METIHQIELRDASIFPDEQVLKAILGDSYPAFHELLELYAKYQMTVEWRYYRDGKAWLCKVQYKKKTMVWMSAWKGFMQATIYVPEKYIEEIFALAISDKQKEKFKTTRWMGKSKAFTFEVREATLLKDFEIVLKKKMVLK